MSPVMIDAFHAARDLAQRVEALARRITPDADDDLVDYETLDPGPDIPTAVLAAYCSAHGFEVPASLMAALAAIPQSYDWRYDLDDFDVVDTAISEEGLHGGFLWFNDIAAGEDFSESLRLAHQYLRPPGVAALVPFAAMGNGDVLGLVCDDGSVWYLDHEDPVAGSGRLANSLDDFFRLWAGMYFASCEDLALTFLRNPALVAAYREQVDAALAREEPLESDGTKSPDGLSLLDPTFPDRIAAQLGRDHPLARAAQEAQDRIEKSAPGIIQKQARTKVDRPKRRWWWPFGS